MAPSRFKKGCRIKNGVALSFQFLRPTLAVFFRYGPHERAILLLQKQLICLYGVELVVCLTTGRKHVHRSPLKTGNFGLNKTVDLLILRSSHSTIEPLLEKNYKDYKAHSLPYVLYTMRLRLVKKPRMISPKQGLNP